MVTCAKPFWENQNDYCDLSSDLDCCITAPSTVELQEPDTQTTALVCLSQHKNCTTSDWVKKSQAYRAWCDLCHTEISQPAKCQGSPHHLMMKSALFVRDCGIQMHPLVACSHALAVLTKRWYLQTITIQSKLKSQSRQRAHAAWPPSVPLASSTENRFQRRSNKQSQISAKNLDFL